MKFLWKLFCMHIRREAFWPLLREIRNYARDTGLKIVVRDDVMKRSHGFETDCSEFKSEYRYWSIGFTHTRVTARDFNTFLDGEKVQHEAQRALMRRYLQLLSTGESRALIAEALTTGVHPTQESVDAILEATKASSEIAAFTLSAQEQIPPL